MNDQTTEEVRDLFQTILKRQRRRQIGADIIAGIGLVFVAIGYALMAWGFVSGDALTVIPRTLSGILTTVAGFGILIVADGWR